MNGTVNLSVLDGWWAEGYRPGAGWGLQEKRTYANQGYQDELDAELIYDIIEEQVIPEFFDLKNGVPERWIRHIKNTIAWIAPDFTMKRMLDDYRRNYYDKLVARSRAMKENNCQLAKDIDQWKSKVLEAWNGVGVKRLSVPDSTRRPLVLGDDFIAEIEISLNGLRPDDLGIDVLFGQKDGDVVKKLLFREEMTMVRTNHERVLFTCRLPMERVGVYDYAFRLYPKNPVLPHRQDFGLVRWI
jgi:glucan phosphorylase